MTAAVAQVLAVALGAPLLTGLMRQVRARLEGRAGAGVLQPWRDLRKLARKQATTPHGTTWAFAAAPIVLAATAVTVAAVVPLAQVRTPLDGAADLIAVTALLALGTAALALAGLDSGTAFGGMGASREMTVMALAEPTLLLAVFALSVPAGSTNPATSPPPTRPRPCRSPRRWACSRPSRSPSRPSPSPGASRSTTRRPTWSSR